MSPGVRSIALVLWGLLVAEVLFMAIVLAAELDVWWQGVSS
jgi:hypothetical protein